MGSRIRKNVKQLFHCFCEVVYPKSGFTEGKIIEKFPDTYQDEEVLKHVPSFTYPCELEHSAIQHYSFVLTGEDSKWTFGFCRFDPKIDAAFVFLSSHPWHDAFYRILNQVSEISHNNNPVEKRRQFLEALFLYDISNADSVVIHRENERKLTVHCPSESELPSIPENRNITEYFSAADAHNMAAIFASLLHERRIVIVSKRLPRLSGCVQAAAALLYPMHWQHVFIPILPQALAECLCMPMPFLIGVPLAVFQCVNGNDLNEVVVFDADTNTLQSPFDDLQSLPPDVVSSLRRELRSQTMLGDGVSRAFLHALVMMIGGYRNALRLNPGQRITFHPDAFVESRPLTMQPFLRKVLQLQIFQQFIEERLDTLNSGGGFSDEFEREICLYSGGGNSRIHQQYKEWKRTMRREGSAFLKIVRNKTNPAMKSAVKSVREHGRDVRAACRDIRSRLLDDRPSAAPRAHAASMSHASSPGGPSEAGPHAPPRHHRLKASASYKRRPLQVGKSDNRARSESAPSLPQWSSAAAPAAPAAASPGPAPVPPARASRLTPAHRVPVTVAPVLEDSSEDDVGEDGSEVAGEDGEDGDPGPSTSAVRGSGSEELLLEYGLDFSALRLRADPE